MNYPKIPALLATATLLALPQIHAALILQESINYANEAATDAAFLYDDGGKNHFSATGLTHPSLATVSGGKVSFIGDRIKQSLSQSFGTAAGDGTLYVQFLMQSQANNPTGGVFRSLELYSTNADGDANRVYALGLLRADGNIASAQFEQRVYGTGQTNANTPDLGAFNASVNLFVAKFTFTGGGANFTADAWLNPNDTTDFTAASNRVSGTNLSFNHFGLASFADDAATGSGVASFDEVIFGTTAPVLIPEPSGLLLTSLSAIGFLGLRRRK